MLHTTIAGDSLGDNGVLSSLPPLDLDNPTRPKRNKSKAHFRVNRKVPEFCYRAVERLLKGYCDLSKRIAKHVVLHYLDTGEPCPISSAHYNRKAGSRAERAAVVRDLQRMADDGILSYSEHSTAEGMCREYTPGDVLIGAALGPRTIELDEYLGLPKVDFETGRRSTRCLKSLIHDYNGNKCEPPLVIGSFRELEENGRLFNKCAVENHLYGLKMNADRWTEKWRASGKTRESDPWKKTKLQKSWERAVAQWLNDYRCWTAVLDQNPVHVGDGIYRYTPAYCGSLTGRIFERGGGLQSCSGAMKKAAVGGIKNLTNFDLRAAHLTCFQFECRMAKIPTPWIDDYLANYDQRKKDYPARLGVSERCWKKCLLAYLYGSDPRCPFKGIWKDIKSEVGPVRVRDVVEQFIIETEEFKREADAWRDWLFNDRIPGIVKYCPQPYIPNRCGKHLFLVDADGKRAEKSVVTSFILQGYESAFIHALTIIGRQYGFRVIGNEHDGCIVIDEKISPEAISEAKRISGVDVEFELVKKAF